MVYQEESQPLVTSQVTAPTEQVAGKINVQDLTLVSIDDTGCLVWFLIQDDNLKLN